MWTIGGRLWQCWGMAFTFESDQDFGPYESLFGNFQDYNVSISTSRGVSGDATIRAAGRDHVRVQLWRKGDDFEATGKVVSIPYDELEEVVVY